VSTARILREELARLSLVFPKETEQKLVVYLDELDRWTRKMNLTALTGAERVRRLVAEPAWIAQQLQMSGGLVDVGSGNGCPGVSMCVTRGLEKACLVEARAKRAAFLRHVSGKVGLKSIEVYESRLQDVTRLPAPMGWATMQAVSPTGEILQALRRLTSPTTRVVWITSNSACPCAEADLISVPGSNTEAWVFQLDQF